jgi:large subunit ribosomal protein L3
MANFRTGLLGKKLAMTQVFNELGNRVGVTVIHAGGCVVIGKRTPEKDGYAAIRLGYGQKPLRLCKKPELGEINKLGNNNLAPPRIIREIRLDPAKLADYEIGATLPLSKIFKPGTYVDVVGTSKGKGFQGVVKRHHMAASVGSHGTHEFFRHGGSIGCRLTPGRVHKGKRMTGHMGDERVTTQNLAHVDVKDDTGLLLVRGSVPGGENAMLIIRNAKKRTGLVRLITEDEGKAKKGAAKKPAAAAAKKK